MTQIYGSLWTDRYGDATDGKGHLSDTVEAWRSALAHHRITPHEIAGGIELCVSREICFPPSMPEFISLCKRQRPAAAYHKEFKALPKPIDRELAAASLSRIREMLAAGPGTGKGDQGKPPSTSEPGRDSTSETGEPA